ncbi:MAG: HIT family protein [Actinomycetota bacterium]
MTRDGLPTRTLTKMCIFCSIIDGTAAAEIVYQDENAVGFLDLHPLFPGHTLLVPREHHETLPDLPLESVAPLFAAARLLSNAIP